ncbi:replicative DNA helicase [Thermanaerovibrio acidaminovorans DSM 6589]|uniref:Replicative DNA helicase n=1 Tax=Thermanaerovibrio acidaminovorans (strain ATCC 49978 / DSM 6589 / Su883) TaxID=525903 RepID=D1B9D8_THEAS|nr:replicative DNA helicase [Thermanaerovibrio acidaminovorans]ACZ18891.1 replicative DNA helicase [Thermanaerovibrio acidaminovorans DSM 6589]
MSEVTFDRVPPHNLEAERSALGACLLDREAMLAVTELLSPLDFYDQRHRLIFELIQDMARKDKVVDALTFLDEAQNKGMLERMGGSAFVAALADSVTTTANAEYHARIVKDKAIHRRLIQVGGDIARLGYQEDRPKEEILDEAERMVFEIGTGASGAQVRPIKRVMGETFRQIEERFASGSIVTGVPTGFDDFDRLTGGLQPGSLNILAARPSMGKTAFALNIAQNAAVRGRTPVLIFSLEMGAEQLAQRLLGAEAGVNIHDLRTGRFPESCWDKLARAAGTLSEAPLFIDDSSMLSTLEMRARCRRFLAHHGSLGLVVVDYLQLMSLPGRVDSKQQEVAEISRALKGVAREFNVPVLALSQLSRAVELRNDKRPQLSDLRDSGAIEQDADLVILLYRPGYYERDQADTNIQAEAIVAKHRNGPTGKVDLVFLKEFAKFEGLERRYG